MTSLVSPWPVKVLGIMHHHHQWQKEPPEGKLMWSKSFDERYGDEEDMAANAMFNDPEEIHRLRLHLKKDPSFETSSIWPYLVEWCSNCPLSRTVRLVLPPEQREVVIKEEMEEEESVDDCKVEEATVQDACTQTPPQEKRWERQQNKANVGFPTHAHCQAQTASVSTPWPTGD